MTNLLAIRKYLRNINRSLSEQMKSKRKNGEKGRGNSPNVSSYDIRLNLGNSRNVSTYDIQDTGGQR